MHLTNYSLNVQSGNYVHSDSQNTGSKRTLSSVLYRLAAKGVDIKRVWSDIIALVIKSIIAVLPDLKVHYQADIPPAKPGPTCFQVGVTVELQASVLLTCLFVSQSKCSGSLTELVVLDYLVFQLWISME